MSSLIDADFKNLEQISRFPNRQDSHIKAYRGVLAITGESALERFSASWSGTPFSETVQVIKTTCLKVLMCFSGNLLTDSGIVKKIEGLKQGLANIKNVYAARYGRDAVVELETLETQICQQFPAEKREEDEWELVLNDDEMPLETPKSLATAGQLPGFMASVYAGAKTGLLLSTGGTEVDPRSRVLNPGMQLRAADVNTFIQNLGIDGPVHVIDNFYLRDGSGINIQTLDEIKAVLARQSIEPNSAIIIPINFISQEVFGRNHIAVIVIKNNTVEYYDAKGVYSINRALADDHTLREVIAYCQQKWTKDGKILENPYPHQTDANNCGMFVCKRLREIFKFNLPLGDWEPAGPSIGQIRRLRKEIADIAYPTQPGTSSEEPTMAADDEMDDLLDT